MKRLLLLCLICLFLNGAFIEIHWWDSALFIIVCFLNLWLWKEWVDQRFDYDKLEGKCE